MEIAESIRFASKLYTFLSGLGMPVSPVEFAQTAFVIEQSRPDTYDALKRTIVPVMAKTREHQILLQQIMDFLLGTSDNWDRLGQALGPQRIDPGILRQTAPSIARMAEWINHPELFYRRLQELYLELYNRYGERLMSSGYMMLSDALELGRPEKELVALGSALELAGWCPEDIKLVTSAIENMLLFIRKGISEFIMSASKVIGATRALHSGEPKSGPRELWDVPLSFLSRKDIETINQIIKRVALRLRQDIKRRQYGVLTSEVSIRQTLRSNAGRDALIQLGYSKIKKLESPLIVLCDISGSMRNYARFFMQFISIIKDTFKRLRVFVFVSDIKDVTTLVRSRPADEVIDRIFTDYREARAYTDYGNVLKQFTGKNLGLITSKTRLLIIGDGRTNYQYPGEEELAVLKKKSKDILWFTPDEQYSWFIGDSEMNLYSRYTDGLFVVRTLSELTTALESLMDH